MENLDKILSVDCEDYKEDRDRGRDAFIKLTD